MPLSFVINSSMNERDPRMYVESKIPAKKHKHLGWFWHLPTKKFYRWNDFPGHNIGIENGDS